jgi:hypothetical protein
MSIWVNVFCRRSVGSLRPEELAQGIKHRLAVMTYLLLPEEEEEPGIVSQRLRVETASSSDELRRMQIHYRAEREWPLIVERWSEPRAVADEVREFLEKLESRSESAVKRILEHLRSTTESVGIDLKAKDARGMGWPVAICAAAEIAERGDGIIHAEGSGWMVPSGKEVDIILPD